MQKAGNMDWLSIITSFLSHLAAWFSTPEGIAVLTWLEKQLGLIQPPPPSTGDTPSTGNTPFSVLPIPGKTVIDPTRVDKFGRPQ
jgi:hypothetical protein